MNDSQSRFCQHISQIKVFATLRKGYFGLLSTYKEGLFYENKTNPELARPPEQDIPCRKRRRAPSPYFPVPSQDAPRWPGHPQYDRFLGSHAHSPRRRIRKRRKTYADDPPDARAARPSLHRFKMYGRARPRLSRRLGGKWANERHRATPSAGGGPGIMEANARRKRRRHTVHPSTSNCPSGSPQSVHLPGTQYAVPLLLHPASSVSCSARALIRVSPAASARSTKCSGYSLIRPTKLYRAIPVVLYRPDYWNKLLIRVVDERPAPPWIH